MAEELEAKITERDEIAEALQAEPDDTNPEAALEMAVKMITRHGELMQEIEQLEAELQSQTDGLSAMLS